MWISEVPGFVKQTSTQPASSVRIRLSAPFILSSLQIFSELAKYGQNQAKKNSCWRQNAYAEVPC